MPKEQTSSKVSTLAAKVLDGYKPTAAEVKTMAASLLTQDERKGQAPTKKVAKKKSAKK